MAGNRSTGATFWVTYSDLATGLMIVFMVVMLLMVIMSKQQDEKTSDEVRHLVAEIQIILGARTKVAEAVQESLEHTQIQVDPVTAQLTIPEELLRFDKAETTLNVEHKAFLNEFAPTYICALWEHEKASCDGCRRVDPQRPSGVRRILVTGHGDLTGSSLDTHFYAKERAFYVTKYVTKLLYECAGSDTDLDGCPAAVDVSASCESHMLDIAGYASERLWPAGAGNTRHCIDRLAQPDAEEARLTGVPICDDYGDNSGSYRSVEFMLELTGDDMTGMLLDVRALQKTVGIDPDQSLDELAETVATECWINPNGSYHGCKRFIEECISADPADREEFCIEYDEALTDSSDLRGARDEFCLIPENREAPGCPR